MSALVLLALVAIPCEPRVDLTGEAALVHPVERALQAHLSNGASGCPMLQVDLQRRDGSIAVSIVETSGRKVARTVRDPDLLVPLIESWLHAELADPLLLPPSPPQAVVALEEAPAPRRAEPDRPLVEVGAMFEFGFAERAEVELGLAIVAALGLGGAIEPTLTLRGSAPSRLDTAGLSAVATSRTAELLLGARAPFVFGPVSLVPGIGIGIGVDDIQREVCLDCGPIVLDGAGKTKARFRAEASLMSLVPIYGASFLQLGLSAGVSPFASSVQELPGWAEESEAAPPHLALPAAPRHRLRASLGFGWRWF